MMKNFAILFVVMVLTASCTKNPVADFTFEKGTIYTNDTVVFSNHSFEATEFEWLADSAVFSTDRNASYVFETPGQHKITLIAKNDGLEDVVSQYITVDQRTSEFKITNQSSYKLANVTSFSLRNSEIKDLNNYGDFAIGSERGPFTSNFDEIYILFFYNGVYFQVVNPYELTYDESARCIINDNTLIYVLGNQSVDQLNLKSEKVGGERRLTTLSKAILTQ